MFVWYAWRSYPCNPTRLLLLLNVDGIKVCWTKVLVAREPQNGFMKITKFTKIIVNKIILIYINDIHIIWVGEGVPRSYKSRKHTTYTKQKSQIICFFLLSYIFFTKNTIFCPVIIFIINTGSWSWGVIYPPPPLPHIKQKE